jgi:hypothetical protein
MAGSDRQSPTNILILNYVIVFLVFGSLYYVTPSVTSPFTVSEKSSLWDWLIIVSILALTWSIWLAMVRQRCLLGLGLWRLLGANLGAASIGFVISAAAFVISAVNLDLALPPESNLMDSNNASLIAVYSRIPILSHPLALYILITTLTYKLVESPTHFRKGILTGGLLMFLYYFMMYAGGLYYRELLHDLLVNPEGTHVLIMFVYWIPTVLAALAAYIAYAIAFKAE